MAYPSVTYTFVASGTARSTEVNRNFQDIVDGFSDGSKSLNMNAGAFAGTVTAGDLVASGAVTATSAGTTLANSVFDTWQRTVSATAPQRGIGWSSGSGVWTSNIVTAACAMVSGTTLTIVTTGRPVNVFLTHTGSATAGQLYIGKDSYVGSPNVRIYRDSSSVYYTSFGGTVSGGVYTPCSTIHFLDNPTTAGTHTYELYAYPAVSATTIGVYCSRLVAFEL